MSKKAIIDFLDDLNEIVIEVGVKLVTILVPMPSAISLYAAMEPVIGAFGSFVMALVIELFGMAAVDNNYLSWLNKDKVDPRISYWITASYVVVAEAVIFAFKVYQHDIVNLVFMLFPLLSIMGFVLMMNRRTIVNAQGEIDNQFKAAIDDLQKRLDDAQSTINNGSQLMTEKEKLISELTTKVDGMSAQIDYQNSTINDSQNRLSETQKMIVNLQSEIDKLTIENERLSKEALTPARPKPNRQKSDSKKMKTDERRELTESLLSDGDVKTIQELIDATGATRNTVNKDLELLGWQLNGDGFKKVLS